MTAVRFFLFGNDHCADILQLTSLHLLDNVRHVTYNEKIVSGSSISRVHVWRMTDYSRGLV